MIEFTTKNTGFKGNFRIFIKSDVLLFYLLVIILLETTATAEPLGCLSCDKLVFACFT